ncbi:hypothetical protein A2U01_0054412 [Trifolium medium]|uniref:Uncharacterized protein n=1 Tax=Trifolium medium TaxID=97028 RepID=A0A392RBH2_9FABA|nr:hypothetical protein [Trifolium medium]
MYRRISQPLHPSYPLSDTTGNWMLPQQQLLREEPMSAQELIGQGWPIGHEYILVAIDSFTQWDKNLL